MSSGSGKWVKIKLQLVAISFVAVFVAVLLTVYDLQVVKRDELVSRSRNETVRTLNLGEVRGEILDINGERLAASLAVSSVVADPSLMVRKEKVDGKMVETDHRPDIVAKLSEILDMDEETLNNKLDLKKKFVYIKRQLEFEQAEAVSSLDLPGIRLSKEYRRSYPNGPLAAHFLGFVGIDDHGLEGLELALDNTLKAGKDKIKVKIDRDGRRIVDNISADLEQARGASVVLTIDRRIQYITEKALARAVATHDAKSGMALVMKPTTGAVVASAVWPPFDPNEYKSADTNARRNRNLTDPFEPGSTFKVFVVAAALEETLVTPNSIFNCEKGQFRVGNHTVKDTHSYEDLTVSEIIKFSSNIGALKVGAELGNDMLYNYLKRFSFGERTGLAHLPGEASGLLRHSSKWRQVEAANIAFGQGLSVTTLQMVMAMSSLANQGVMMKPYIVDRVVDENGQLIQQYEPQILRQVVSPLTARQVAAMLRMAVQKGGTATRAEVAGYPVAGKTGTAQKVANGSRGYAAGKYVASFLGFAPYHDPQLCVMVVLDEPKNGYYGGTVATPAFREIMEYALPLMDIPPSEGMGEPFWPSIEAKAGGAPGVVDGNHPTNFVRGKIKKGDRGARGPITFGDMDEEQAMNYGEAEPDYSDLSVSLTADPGVMPNLAGLSMRQVMEIMSYYALDLDYYGSGHVVGQSPPAGASIMSGQSASVIFER